MHNKLKAALAKKYVYKPYNKSFPKHFTAQKKYLLKLFKRVPKVEVHHIGSTSVPNLGGKGIIDIIVVVPKKYFSKGRKLLEEKGFVYHSTMRKKRSFFYKYYVVRSAPRLVHLHLTYHTSGELIKAIAFREYLRNHKHISAAYAKIKKKASKLHHKEGKKYVKHKLNFIKSTLTKALEWHKMRRIHNDF